MRDRLASPPPQSAAARRRRSAGVVFATLALVAVGGFFAVRRLRGPATVRYRLERIDRGPIRSDVIAPGTVSAFPMTPDLSRLEVWATVGEPDVRGVAVGQAVTLLGRACPDCASTGTVSAVRLSPRGSGDVEGSTVLVEADNRDQKLRPGMTASVSIEVARRDGVLRLPLRALTFTPRGMERTAPSTPPAGRVYVLDDDGRPRPVSVTVGLQDAFRVELVAGPLAEGDAVIVDEERAQR
jgi:hypothetical protein